MTGKAKVLVVDDHVEMTETLSDILEDLGYHVETANNGFEAIKKAESEAFDVVLLDVKMPGIDGVKTCREIKRIQPESVVMMMTAASVENLVADTLKEGDYGVWYKPLDIDKAVEFIEHVKNSALILIVDDDSSACETLMDALRERGYRTASASCGEEALKKVRQQSFDVVLVDIKMPVMDGVELYLALRKIRPNIKAIMMTGYRQELRDLVEEAIRKNAYACIYKPFAVEEMLKLVDEVLARKNKQKFNGWR
jgi:DNA-binding NtrC family response regulator